MGPLFPLEMFQFSTSGAIEPRLTFINILTLRVRSAVGFQSKARGTQKMKRRFRLISSKPEIANPWEVKLYVQKTSEKEIDDGHTVVIRAHDP